MSDKKATKVSFAESNEIQKYSKEIAEINQVLQQSPSLFISDKSRVWYHTQSSQRNIDYSAFNFALTRLTIAYGIDFSSIFTLNHSPLMIDMCKFIQDNRTSETLNPIPNHLKYWGGIVRIIDETVLDPAEQEINATMIINMKEQLDYHKGLALEDESFKKSGYLEKEYVDFLKNGKVTIHFDDNSTKEFSNKEEIYYFLIASCSNNPKFTYSPQNSLN